MKNLHKKKVNVLGKKIPVLLLGLIVVAGLGTAALLPFFGQIIGQATVSQGLLVDGESMDESESFKTNWDGDSFTSLQAKTFVDAHTLDNNANVDANVSLDIDCDATETNCNGINYTTVEYFDEAGIQSYDFPVCDVNVSSGEDIRTNGIDQASDNEIVCVEAGNYDGFIVNKPLTLVAIGEVGINQSPVGSPSAMVQIAASDVTIEGFVIDSKDKNHALENTGSSDNMVLRNNKFTGNTHGVYINPSTETLIKNNIFDVEGVAIGSDGHTGTVVKHNVFTETVGVEIMGASGVYDVDFYSNNIYTDAPLADYFEGDFDANNNYFAKGIQTSGNVDASYKEKGPAVTVPNGETDTFGILVEFPKMTYPDTYTVTTTVNLDE